MPPRFRSTPAAYELLLEGQLALAEIERAGVRVDREYLDAAFVRADAEIKAVEEQIRADPDFRLWQRRFGTGTKLSAPEQLSDVLYKDLGYKPKEFTESGKRGKADEAALEGIDRPLVKLYFQAQKLRKGRDTYLAGIRREMVRDAKGRWYVHPSYNLNTVTTFRSSCDSPNWQNIPKRNKMLADMIRRCYIPRDGYQFVEIDYGQAEVRVAACYNRDPNLIKYVSDPTTDMHRDVARRLFFLGKDEPVPKGARNLAKANFVFAEFYGDFYPRVAQKSWEIMGYQKLEAAAGESLYDRLRANGITKLGACDPDADPRPGTYEKHVRDVERWFWDDRFPVYKQWKRDWFTAYQRSGGFEMLTGFAVNAPLSRNDVVNYPIQGCLPGTARVRTRHGGWVPIRELVGRATEVWTGFRWASAVGISRGRCRRATVALNSGVVVECDTRHKFKNEMGDWVKFDDLKEGDWVALPKCDAPLAYSGRVNWWFVYGFLTGDGWFNNRNGVSGGVSITGGEVKKNTLEEIRSFWQSEGYADGGRYRGIRWAVIPPTEGRTQNRYKLSLQDERLTQRLKADGFDFEWTAHTKRVVEAVWRASPQDQRDYLEGLWLSDGARNDGGHRSLHMCNRELLRDVQVLAAGVGFDSVMAKTGDGWKLTFHFRKFNGKPPRRYPFAAVRRQVDRVEMARYARRNDAICDARVFRQGKDFSQFVGERIIETHAPEPVVYRYDRVVSKAVRDEEEETFTMSVDDPLHQFVADGVIVKNSAFHCLLFALIKIVRWLKKHKMRTRVVGEIHDCVVLDAHPAELNDVVAYVRKAMVQDVPRAWDWVVVPLEASVEVGAVDAPWLDVKECELKNGAWTPKG